MTHLIVPRRPAPNFFMFLAFLSFLVVVFLVLMGLVQPALADVHPGPIVLAQAESTSTLAALFANPIVVGILVSAFTSLLAYVLAHTTGAISWLQAHTVIQGHAKLTASAQQLEGMVGNFVVSELQGVATAVAAAGPNPSAADLQKAAAQAKANGIAKARAALQGTALLADATQLLGIAGLNAHIDAVAGAAVTSALLQTTGTAPAAVEAPGTPPKV